MDMQKIKPYMFWIVCGVILVVQLVYFGMFLEPSPPEDPNVSGLQPPPSAEAAHAQLDKKLEALDQLLARARKTNEDPPQNQVIDPSNARVLREYIVSADWEAQLKGEVQRREERVRAIITELSERSALLHEPVSVQTDPVAWYADYEEASAALVRYLIDEGVVPIPDTVAAGPLDDDFYRTNRTVRQALGLVTADGNQQQFSDPSRRRQVAREFRLINAVARALAEVRVAPEPHPLAAEFSEVPTPSPQRVTIAGIALRSENADEHGRTTPVELQLRGSPAALLDAMRRLDGITRPIAVRLGSRWSRREFNARDKHNVADVPMDWQGGILVFDFHDQSLDAN